MKIRKSRTPSPFQLEELGRRNSNFNSRKEMDRSAKERLTGEKTKSRQDRRSIRDIVENLERGGRCHFPTCYTSPKQHADHDVQQRLDGLAEEQDNLKDGLNNLLHLDVGAIQHTIKTLVDQMNACSHNVSFLRTEQELINAHYKGLTGVIGTNERIKLPSIFQTKQSLNVVAENDIVEAQNHSQNASKAKRTRKDVTSSDVGDNVEDNVKETDGKAASPDQQLPSLFKTKKQIKAERRQRVANRLRENESYDHLPVYLQTATGGLRKSDRKLGHTAGHQKPDKRLVDSADPHKHNAHVGSSAERSAHKRN